jgi:hypothetical protein
MRNTVHYQGAVQRHKLVLQTYGTCGIFVTLEIEAVRRPSEGVGVGPSGNAPRAQEQPLGHPKNGTDSDIGGLGVAKRTGAQGH